MGLVAGNVQQLYLQVTSIIPDRNILLGFPFPLNRKRDVSDIRCQRVEMQRERNGFAVAIKVYGVDNKLPKNK